MKTKKWNRVYDYSDKVRCANNYNYYMLNRTRRMFRWSGLPDSIPERMLEIILQQAGFACIAEHEGELYAFTGSLGGEPDAYYQPTKCVVANPALKLSKEYEIGKDCIIINNDTLRMGLLPMNKRYACLLVENDISMRIYDINSRINMLISAPDDRTKQSAINYLKDLEDGKLGVISENAFLEGIKAQSGNQRAGSMTELIEYEQYLKASWFNELGLQSNYNMKRESINSNEAQLNEDALLPLIDDMLEERKAACELINNMFGTSISVELASSWEDNQEELELAHEMEEAAADQEEDEENLQEDEDNLQEDEEEEDDEEDK